MEEIDDGMGCGWNGNGMAIEPFAFGLKRTGSPSIPHTVTDNLTFLPS